MNKLFQITSIAVCLLSVSACRKAHKNIDDYYPTVSTVSAVVNEDGDVEVTGDVTLKTGSLHYIGFCMDTLPVPDMLKNQEIVTELNGSQFKTVYSMNYNPAKTYYFRSWAASSYGYKYGEVLSLSNIRAAVVSAPCTLNPNSSNIGLVNSGPGPAGSVYNVSGVSQSSSTWNISCNGYDANAGRLSLSFGSEPKTKVYTTTEGGAYGNLVSISITSGFTSGVVKAGSKVYVNKISEGIFEITICDAPWKVDGSSFTSTLNARFKSPY